MNEIVGARIGTIITNSPRVIAAAIRNGTITEFLDRRRMQLMAVFDLGQNWTNMANGPTLFIVDDDGKPVIPEATKAQ